MDEIYFCRRQVKICSWVSNCNVNRLHSDAVQNEEIYLWQMGVMALMAYREAAEPPQPLEREHRLHDGVDMKS